MKKTKGFTLIELMIAVAILGLLMAIAIPSYRDSVRKSNRVDAKISLSSLSAMQEKFFFRTNGYATTFASMITGAGTTIPSDDGFYTISMVSTGTAWTMTATAQGGQLDDTDCRRLVLNSLGAKTSFDSSSVASTGCW